MVDREGGSSEGCLKWVVGVILNESLQKHLKTRWVKVKVVCRGDGVLKVSPPLPPTRKF